MSVNTVSDVRSYIIFNVSTSKHLFHRWHQFLFGCALLGIAFDMFVERKFGCKFEIYKNDREASELRREIL